MHHLGRQLDDVAGQQQPPGGGVDEHGMTLAQVGVPLGLGQFVADQPVGGFGIRDAQQRLGQAHQHYPFL